MIYQNLTPIWNGAADLQFLLLSIASKIAPSIIHSIPYPLKSALTTAMLYLYPVKGFHKLLLVVYVYPLCVTDLFVYFCAQFFFLTKYLLYGRWPQNEGHIVSSSQLQEKAYFQRKINQISAKKSATSIWQIYYQKFKVFGHRACYSAFCLRHRILCV